MSRTKSLGRNVNGFMATSKSYLPKVSLVVVVSLNLGFDSNRLIVKLAL